MVLPELQGIGAAPGEAREGGFGAESAGMRPGDEELGGGDRADAVVAKQLWRELLDEDGELALE